MAPRSSVRSPLLAAALALGLAACADGITTPVAAPTTLEAHREARTRFNAATDWNLRATAFAGRRGINSSRLYTYMSLAQLRAAQDAKAVHPHQPMSAAIGAASAAVMTAFFNMPAEVAAIEAALDSQEVAMPRPRNKHVSFAAGEALGRATAARVMAWAAGDRIGLTSPGVAPVGPGRWVPPGGVMLRGNLGARLIFLQTANDVDPGPPPAFGSPEFVTALTEVRRIADTRTRVQDSIARFWNVYQSPASAKALNDLAVEFLRDYRRNELESARVLFLMNAAGFDANAACFQSKYVHWYLRPAEADPGIRVVFPTPAHPSYPSAHSCFSGAFAGVLEQEFPKEAARLAAIADESSLSRLYAGIHYRFDMTAGLALGRAVAVKAVAANLDHVGVR